jgi:tetratricopeptide (TPR) repeat protein
MAQGQPDQALKIQHLCNSLEYDPSDRTSYLQILAHYQKSGNTSAYKDWLNKALSEFPEDIDILMQATQAATANRTYKKAIQYAEKILKIDPVNSYAKQLVFTSHLNHARRLLKTHKLHLVAAEIQRAENLKLGKTYALQTDLLRGLLGFANNDKSQVLQLVVPALNKLNPEPATAHFQATMEACIERGLLGLRVHLHLEVALEELDELAEVQPIAPRGVGAEGALIDQVRQEALDDWQVLVHGVCLSRPAAAGNGRRWMPLAWSRRCGPTHNALAGDC